MSITTVPYRPPGAAIDHGLVPIRFSLPPQGAIPAGTAVYEGDYLWIESWYNVPRLHSSLGYRSPVGYEAALAV